MAVVSTISPRFVLKASALLFAAASLSQCSTMSHRGTQRHSAKSFIGETQTEKAGTKSIDDNAHFALITPVEPQKIENMSNDELASMYVKLNAGSTKPSDADVTKLSKLPNKPSTGSLQEAVIVIGLLKQIAYGDAATNSAGETLSLEKVMAVKGINLANAIAKNSYLKSYDTFRTAIIALHQTNNEPEFVDEVRKTIDTEVGLWTSLTSNDETSATSVQDAENNQGMMDESGNLSAADFRSGDTLLVEAQNLADNKRYGDAITKANLIDKDSPLYEAAHNKIILFSNEAVQELREKAAQAFQSAMPMSDQKAKAAYLEKAKSHLEDALSNFPEAPAEQLSTVRENLAVISRNLENLDPEEDEDYNP